MDHVAIDLATLPTSTRGNNYLLVLIDIFTRFAWLRPLPDKTGINVAKTLMNIFMDFTFPKIIQSDNGTEFVNSIIQNLTSATSMDHRLVSPYNP